MQPRHWKGKTTVAIFIAFAFSMAILASVGVWNWYSPVPFWDMWDGTLGFIVSVSQGNTDAWFAQHNEHRIVLSRLLFWIDYRLFGGQSSFLITFNLVIVLASCFLFGLFILTGKNSRSDNYLKLSVLFFSIGSLFCWSQQQNFAWAFQSQFLLAQLLPLSAMYCFARSSEPRDGKYFYVAVGLGVISAGTMANGIITLPLMFLMSGLLPVTFQRRLIIGVAAVIVPLLYFTNYVPPEAHGSLNRAIVEQPVALIEYTLRYLGSPAYFLFGQGDIAFTLSLVSGIVVAIAAIYSFFTVLSQRNRSPYILALLFFTIYIAGTAFGTGGGRIIFGVSQALSSRYTTPAIMSWIAIITTFHLLHEGNKRKEKILYCVMGIMATPMLIYQINALSIPKEILFNRDQAALAIELGIEDLATIENVFPEAKTPLAINKDAKALNISPLSAYPFGGLAEELGTTIIPSEQGSCIGSLDEASLIEEDDSFFRVRGWSFDEGLQSSPMLLRFIDSENRIIGFALSGAPRPDVADAVHANAVDAGFYGYMKSFDGELEVRIVGSNPECISPVRKLSAPPPVLVQ